MAPAAPIHTAAFNQAAFNQATIQRLADDGLSASTVGKSSQIKDAFSQCSNTS
ncbi:MAG: hypothetical protein QUV06_01405 [Cyanobium sp. CZS 48M]|nr:hypothetical protein [Cyanobium sp. CZS48M]